MLKRWAAGPPGIRWLAGIAAHALAAAIVWALFVPLADSLARHDVGSAKPALQTARDAARGRLLTLAAGLFAAGALVFTARNFNLSREGQVTDRYTKAIEQLGSDKLDVRIGGIYALERVARDSAKDHPTVMEVLTAFIREHSREQWPLAEPGTEPPERTTRPDVQAAATVLGRRTVRYDSQRQPLNPKAAALVRADLTQRGRQRQAINLKAADLTRADLTRADLTGADLTGADLTGAQLDGAKLIGARLDGAKLTGADLHGAILTEAGADSGPTQAS